MLSSLLTRQSLAKLSGLSHATAELPKARSLHSYLELASVDPNPFFMSFAGPCLKAASNKIRPSVHLSSRRPCVPQGFPVCLEACQSTAAQRASSEKQDR